uniref:Uncharacterized protein n=1 Tax=Phaseolus vulgaris TaxID=3885 RepID=Q69F94_PHAVU|nr:hypothetical protein BA14 [Phaseolus vulgaris]
MSSSLSHTITGLPGCYVSPYSCPYHINVCLYGVCTIIASFPFSSCEINSPKRGDENNIIINEYYC